jgi:hypothetical protein
LRRVDRGSSLIHAYRTTDACRRDVEFIDNACEQRYFNIELDLMQEAARHFSGRRRASKRTTENTKAADVAATQVLRLAGPTDLEPAPPA